MKRKGFKIIGGVRYRVQLKVESDIEDHARSKHSHSIVSMALFFAGLFFWRFEDCVVICT